MPGTISGTVVDETGAVIVGARVTLTRTGDLAPREAMSGNGGQFSFTNVLPGDFQLRITASGFAPQVFSGTLRSGEVHIMPAAALLPATVGTEVEVTVPGSEVAVEQLRTEEKQRLVGIVPNFYITFLPDAAPLSSKQKFELAWKSMIDPVTIAFTGAIAGAQQAQNAFSGYGQGVQGYGKRFGANYADNITSTFIGSAILPAILKQDPRYFYKGTGSTRSRILYAIANAVVCKGDNRHWQPNYSAIVGGFASGAISNFYYPDPDRGAGLVFENTLIGTGETAIMNIFQEFFARRLTTHVPSYHSQKSEAPTTK